MKPKNLPNAQRPHHSVGLQTRLHAKLAELAKADQRSVSNLLGVIVGDYLKKRGVSL